MERKNFLRAALGGAAAMVAIPLMTKEEEEVTITGVQGKAAWNQHGEIVWSEYTSYPSQPVHKELVPA